jgi:hypothetical protein
MAKLQLFQYVVLKHSENKAEDSVILIEPGSMLAKVQYVVLKHSENKAEDSVILIEPGSMLAKDDKTVGHKLVRLLPESEMDNLENIEIIVRPF